MPGQDPSKIKMGTIEEEEKDISMQGKVILGIDPDGGRVVFFRDIDIETEDTKLTAYLATDGNLNKSLELGELKAMNGSFNLPVPDGIDTAPYNTVIIRNPKSKKKMAVVEL
ncbi:hypothetical protein [Oscillatoria sp. FACHB-1406]|uniref:hypothetical protein n=1 Tax=Oscillatoria sp. FACHB-1406 TaxID=2692846 RepID=UPI0016871E03|nr:hypothetical protein [Oscillatoria sp. FACHB-1406]MBD2579941.1 hypothetical protein [Oscillatoria sp. FACHB-1406]